MGITTQRAPAGAGDGRLVRRRFLTSVGAGTLGASALSLLTQAGTADADSGSVTLTPTASSQNLVVAQSSGVVPLTLQGSSGQTANLLELQDSSGTVLSRFDAQGRLKIVADAGNDDAGSIVLDNRTRGASPAQVPAINLKKDGVFRWQLGIDTTPGSQGDFDLYHYYASQPSASCDVLYITDELNPKVSINGDRYAPGTLTVYNTTDRPVLVVEGVSGQGSDLAQFWRAGDPAPTFAVGATGILRVVNSRYTPHSSDAPANAGLLYSLNGQLTWLSANGAITTLAPDMAIADGHNISFGSGSGTKIGTASNQKLGFYNAPPIAQPSLTYSRSGASESQATAALRAALSALGLVADATTG